MSTDYDNVMTPDYRTGEFIPGTGSQQLFAYEVKLPGGGYDIRYATNQELANEGANIKLNPGEVIQKDRGLGGGGGLTGFMNSDIAPLALGSLVTGGAAGLLGGAQGAAGSTGASGFSWSDPSTWFNSGVGTDASWGANQAFDAGAENMFGFEGGLEGGLDMSRLTDPSYWNELGGLEGLAESGASGLPGATTTYQSSMFDQLKNMLTNAPTGSQSALQKILSGEADASDWLKLAGSLGSTALGVAGSSAQAGAQSDLASKYWNAGAPSRARFEASMSPGFDPATAIPGYSGALKTTMDQQMASLSTQGNPWGNPRGLEAANQRVVAGTALPAWDSYQRANMAGGQLGFSQAANFDQGAAASSSSIWPQLGFGINALTGTGQSQDNNTLAGLLKQFQGLNLSGTIV